MRYYSITFTRLTQNLQCTVPKTFKTWTSYSMSTIYSSDCCILAGVQQLISIINNVYYQGLDVYSRPCKANIVAKIHSNPNADTNNITLLRED